MKSKEVLEKLVENYDYEFDTNKGEGHSSNWYNVHINMLFYELCDIRDTLFLFKEVEKEWESRVESGAISFSRIRSIIYEALPYRVIMGLSKIFIGKQELSVEKTINVISQRDIYKLKNEVRTVVDNIRTYINGSQMIKIVAAYRDSFYGHLDDYCAMSDIRVAPGKTLERISISEIDMGIELIGNLFEACFGEKLEKIYCDIDRKEIVRMFFDTHST